jgi:RNA polymerase sigma factor for flagellar operon FliA
MLDPTTAREHLAVKLAWKTWNRLKPKWEMIAHVDLDAVRGAALLGAAKALRQWDPERRCKFSSYAICLIRCEMQEELRAQDHLPRSLRNEAKRVEAETGERPRWAEYPCSIEDVAWLGHGDDEWGADPLLRIEQLFAEEDTEAEVLEQVEREELWRAVGWLPENERRVVERYYQEDLTLREIAEGMGRSESRTHQLHAQGIARLRQYLFQSPTERGNPSSPGDLPENRSNKKAPMSFKR